jgi:exopolysaccharide production protein ExoQ
VIPVEFYIVTPYVLAFLLGVGLPLGAALQYRVARSVSSDTRIIVLLAVIAGGALLTVGLTPRNLNDLGLEKGSRLLLTDFDDGFAASRYLNVFIVGAGFVEMLRGWINSRRSVQPDPAQPILIGLVAFYIGTILVQALGSAHPAFSYKSLYVPIVLLAVYYQRIVDLALVVEVAKFAVLALILASLAGIAIKPDFVIHRPETGLIPGVDFRLFGLAPDANAIGPVALIGMMLEFHAPSKSRWLRALHLLPAFAVFTLAQSKTSWVACLLVLTFVAVPLGLLPNRTLAKGAPPFTRAVLTLLTVLCLVAVLAVGLAAPDVIDYLERASTADTLTGRTQIWDITLQAWHENLMFGYGREIWGLERMQKFRMFHVGQAHNQFVQTLGEAGLIGMVLLLAYLLPLVHAALSRFVASRGITLAMLVLVLSRCVTEAPLRQDGVLSWPTFTHILLIVFACHYVRAGGVARARRAPTDVHGGAHHGNDGVARPPRLKPRIWGVG